MHPFIHYQEEVKVAIDGNKPVVALESTVIAHGLPYPLNLETALDLETIVRAEGGIPATICIKNGKIVVGMTKAELLQMAKNGPAVKKVSTRDLSFVLSQNVFGATTVASTMHCAHLAHIPIFATGGIGGVHRDAHVSFDVSADLTELAKTKVAVVCGGFKSILDIAKTLEVLETLRVPVLGYRANELPAFYSRMSGHALDLRLDTPREVARLIGTHFAIANTGLVIANPIDKEQEIPFEHMENLIGAALRHAIADGIKGHQTTPYLLHKLFELSQGKTVLANIALLKNNAKLAAKIAVELVAPARDQASDD